MDEFREERREMVERQLRERRVRDRRLLVTDPLVLAAMERVPRHEFVPATERKHAYEDRPLPIGEGQTISQPYMVAKMTELLEPAGKRRVLEIGTGCGYQTAVLHECFPEVFTIERIPVLGVRARLKLLTLGYDRIRYRICDGSLGWPEESPFDGILVTAGAESVPPAYLTQLADPGVLVMPVGAKGIQKLVTVHRKDGKDTTRKHFECAFVPLVGQGGEQP